MQLEFYRMTNCSLQELLHAFWTEQRVTTVLKRLSTDVLSKDLVAMAFSTNVSGGVHGVTCFHSTSVQNQQANI
jgi:hypothetical protein